jgi:two-component system, sensor histidine kinase and response regulator
MMQPTKANILIVDDTATNLRLLTRILGDAGHVVRPARSGEIALASAFASPPDLILLDVMMPEMDGFEVCRRLKKHELTRDVPIIFISALNDVDEKVKSFSLGAVDYIAKPFHSEEMLARVNTHLTIRRLQNDLMAQIAELDAFAHTVAHDLKNPMALIVGFADFLAMSGDNLTPEERANYLSRIQKAGMKAANIIDELLLLSRVRQQDVAIHPLNMAAIVLVAKDRLAHMIGEYAAQIESPDRWENAYGYAPWVEEIWVNYLSNAIKYGGRPPHIVLGSEQLDNGMARFWIRDNGPGLTPEQQAVLFTEFVRLTKMKIEGHGLGLSIIQRIINKLGGSAGVRSHPGEGSEFYFTLPRVVE